MIPSDLTGIPVNILRKMVQDLEAKLTDLQEEREAAARDYVKLYSQTEELRAKLVEAQRVIGLQAAALEVWKKAYPTVANPTARR